MKAGKRLSKTQVVSTVCSAQVIASLDVMTGRRVVKGKGQNLNPQTGHSLFREQDRLPALPAT